MRRPAERGMRRRSAAAPCQVGALPGVIAEGAANATHDTLLCTPYMYAPPLSGGGMSARREARAFNAHIGAFRKFLADGQIPGRATPFVTRELLGDLSRRAVPI